MHESLFPERLKAARKALGMSQAEIAAAVGVSREYWGRCERGASVPGGEVLAALVATGADANHLLGGPAAAPPLSADERELLALFRSASLGVKAAAIGALQAGIHGGAPRASVTRMGNQAPGSVQVAHVGGSVHVREARKKPGM